MIPEHINVAMLAQSDAWIACIGAAVAAGCSDYDGETRSDLVTRTVELNRVIEKALADARDEALTKACEIVHRATFADGKIQMAGEDLEGEIRRAYLAAAHQEGKT